MGKMQVFDFKHSQFVGYPEDYLLSDQFMGDLAKIYWMRKYLPLFDDDT